jgi:hypothetical protein
VPGPSNWQNSQQPPDFQQPAVANPSQPYYSAPNFTSRPLVPDPASNPFLRVAGQQQWIPPPQPNSDLLTELTKLQALFAHNQHTVNEQILAKLDSPAPTTGSSGALKVADIGTFEVIDMPDPANAILFIDNIRDAVKQYGEARTLLAIKRCCNNAVSQGWLTSLDEKDRDELIISADAWFRLLRRDFMPEPAALEVRAKAEVFKWSQYRSPAKSVSDKIRLLRIAGIVNHDPGVYEVHQGFSQCPELQIPLT